MDFNSEISRFNVLAVTVIISLVIAILFSLSYSLSLNSKVEYIPTPTDGKNCIDYHNASSPSDVGINVGGHPSGLAIDPTRSLIYTIDSSSKKISVIDGTTDMPIKTIPITGIKPVGLGRNSDPTLTTPGHIAIDPWTNILNVAIQYSNILYMFNAETGKQLDNITLNDSPNGINRISSNKSRGATMPTPLLPSGISANNSQSQVITTSKPFKYYPSPDTVSILHSIFEGDASASSPVNDTFIGMDFADFKAYVIGPHTLYVYSGPNSYSYSYTLPESSRSLIDVAVNPDTRTVYMIQSYDNVTALDLEHSNITNIVIPHGPREAAEGRAIAINRNTDLIYALTHIPDKVYTFDGNKDYCLLAEIPVGRDAHDLAIDYKRNMIYVTNLNSGTVSAINGTTNALSAVIRFKISPSNSGYIQCGDEYEMIRLQQNYSRYDVGTDLSCEAIPYSGYTFSSWTGNLVPTTFSRDPNVNSIASIELKVSKYGSLNANFVSSNPLIPEQFWAPLYGIIPAVIASTFIPSIIQWNRGKKLSKRHLEYYSNLIGKTDHDELEKEIAQLYREGKINDSDYGILKDRINNFQDHHDDNPVGITGSPFP